MASESASVELRQARGLAQKLFGRCRDSSNAFKLLAGPTRKLRNHLEEAEEVFDEYRALGPNDEKLLDQVVQCHEILKRVETSLRAYLSSGNEDVEENEVADFKTALDVSERELYRAVEAITNNDESQPSLDKHLVPDAVASPKTPSTQRKSTSSSATGSIYDRKTSHASSGWSASTRDSLIKGNAPNSIGSQSEANAERQSTDENEVYGQRPAFVQMPEPNNFISQPRQPADWRSPFASPDPLSASIEQASSMILGSSDSFSNAAQSLQPRTPNGHVRGQWSTGKAKIVDVMPNSAVAVSNGLASLPQIKQFDTSEKEVNGMQPELSQPQRPAQLNILIRRATGDRLYKARSCESIKVPMLQPEIGSEDGRLLSPESARDAIRRSRSSSASSTLSTWSLDKEDSTTDAHNRLQSWGRDKITLDGQERPMQPGSTTITLDKPFHRQTIARKDMPTVAQIDVGRPSEEAGLDQPRSPPPPMRVPPSPPAARKRPKIPKAIGSPNYRIVNATAAYDSSSSEDDATPVTKSIPPRAANVPVILDPAPRTSVRRSIAAEAQEDGVDDLRDSQTQRRPTREKNSYIQRMMSARAAYTPPESSSAPQHLESKERLAALTSKYSMPALSSNQASPLRDVPRPSPFRRSTLTLPPKASDIGAKLSVGNGQIEKSNNSHQRNRSQSDNVVQRPEISHSQSAPVGAVEKGQHEKDSVPEAGLEVDKEARVAEGLQVYSPSLSKQKSRRSTEATPYVPSLLDRERIRRIVHSWDDCNWDDAEAVLTQYLQVLIEHDALARARRIRHLLGVCASFQGRWREAIPFFLSTLKTPIKDLSRLDDGDCAAAYWLGDTYSFLNQRMEALIAYYVAERSSLFEDTSEHSLRACINAEQAAVQNGQSAAEMKFYWADHISSGNPSGVESILDTHILPTATAEILFDNEPRKARAPMTGSALSFQLDQYGSRSKAFNWLNHHPSAGMYHRMKLSIDDFEPGTLWPMMYDPFLAMSNIRRGRLFTDECDLLDIVNTNISAIPKSGTMNISRVDCFTSTDPTWLVTTIRECLAVLEMEYWEVTNKDGARFMVQYSFMQNNIATTYYFSIALSRHAVRAGYRAEICPDGICSARIVQATYEYDKGVHNSESKRIKKLIREHLDAAVKQRLSTKKESPSVGVPQGVDDGVMGWLQESAVPVLPPKPPPPPPPRLI